MDDLNKREVQRSSPILNSEVEILGTTLNAATAIETAIDSSTTQKLNTVTVDSSAITESGSVADISNIPSVENKKEEFVEKDSASISNQTKSDNEIAQPVIKSSGNEVDEISDIPSDVNAKEDLVEKESASTSNQTKPDDEIVHPVIESSANEKHIAKKEEDSETTINQSIYQSDDKCSLQRLADVIQDLPDSQDPNNAIEKSNAVLSEKLENENNRKNDEDKRDSANEGLPVNKKNETKIKENSAETPPIGKPLTVIEIADDDEDTVVTASACENPAEKNVLDPKFVTETGDAATTNDMKQKNTTPEPTIAADSRTDESHVLGSINDAKISKGVTKSISADLETQHEESKSNITEAQENSDSEQNSIRKIDNPETEEAKLLEEAEVKTASPTPIDDQPTPIDDQPPPGDDTTGDVYYNKECMNYECPREHKQFFRAPLFALSYFKITKKKHKPQFICSACYDTALEMYEEFAGLLAAKKPLLLKDVVIGRQEFVEIIDSSDEEGDSAKAEKAKDSNYLSKDDLKLIEEELDNSIRKVLDNVQIQNQLTWSKTILTSRLKALEAEASYIDDELRSLQRKADNMHVALYQSAKLKVRQLQPLDLNTGRPYTTLDPELLLPPIGEIQRPPIQINETYYAVKNKAIASWVPCKVMEQAEPTILAQRSIKNYKVKFLKSHYQMVKTVSVKHLAYFDPPHVRLPIGSRVIAYFDATSLSRGKEKMMIQSAFYPGIIAEPLKPNNKYRYLIFYDDGYTQYVYHKDVRLVCHVSENVWEDVYPGSREFIQKYLTQYSINRPMVQTQKGQSMTTESYGKWIYARVVDIDCSLIQMQFEGPKSHTEWIYRGSMRLGPVFKEHQKTMQKTQMPISRLPRRTEPFIRYTEDEEATSTQQQQRQQHLRERQLQQQQQQQQQQQHPHHQNEPRAVAKKSVSRQEPFNSSSQPVPIVRHLNNSTIYLEDENKPKGKVVYYTAKRNLPPLAYTPHKCSPACLFKITHNLGAYSPLSKPLLSGWERMILRQKVKKVVTYRGPCGKIVRNMKELRHYLRVTENVLNVENFDFNHETNCLAEYVIDSAIVQMRDISGGQEKMAIPLVNYYDHTMPPECKYSAQRIPTEGVNLNLDEEFLVGCDCVDDCSDKSKCSCWQLTYAGAKYGNPNTPMEEIGYQYKRLYEHVPTGIYECNSRCKCKSNCLNRVVQHSLEMKLQVFKTSNRGWGLRCINDIPRGSFICVYAGHLLTEDRANEGGLDVGDEYFAELDYIEVAEQIKEGYESDAESAEAEDDELFEQEDDDEFTPSKPLSTRSKQRPNRSTRGGQLQNTEEDSQERQMINFNPNAVMDENSMRESSIRKLYGKDESCYVMDAKITGNLGRYFNHSCSPNLFVQNVFVDTHDLRFPWVAFFASTHIRAGTELTWNYNYEVGVVPGKVLYCQCGAPNCRLRLL